MGDWTRFWGARRARGATTLVAAAIIAVAAPEAHATVGIENHNDPAEDPTATDYRIEGMAVDYAYGPYEFRLGEDEYATYGPEAGTYVVQALPQAGWEVADIQCVAYPADPGAFQIDVPNGRVTITRATGAEEHWCSFTNRKASSGSFTSPGVAPAPPPSLIPPAMLPQEVALLRVNGGRRFATVTIRIPERSVIRCQLRRGRTQVVGVKRVVHRPGTWTVKVPLRAKDVAKLRRRGLKRVTLQLRVVVAPDRGAVRVFRYGVIVRI